MKKLTSMYPWLSKRVAFYFGLFCYHTNQYWYIDYFERKIAGINPRDVIKVTPRRGGWPGSVQIETSTDKKRIPFFKFWGPLQLLYLTSPIGCLFCNDHTSPLSDLSFGDAWLQTLMREDNLGSSLVIARNERGLSLLKEAANDGLVVLKETQKEDILQSQTSIFYKKFFVAAARSLVQKKNSHSLKKYVELLPLIHSVIIRNGTVRRLVFNLPLELFGHYAHVLHKFVEFLEHDKLPKLSIDN
jgi:coenzyme F420-reducing hydrogenase beta subunit